MTQQLNPYLHRPGDAREVVDFYRDVFCGAVDAMTFEQGGMPVAEGWGDKLMHSQLTTDAGFVVMVSDSPPGHEVSQGEDVSISLSGTDADALRGYWDKLKVGATVHEELSQAPWGDYFGACTDRFGTSWLVNIGSSEASDPQ